MRFVVGYIHGGINTSDGLTESISSANLRSLLAGDTFRIVTGGVKGDRKKDAIGETLYSATRNYSGPKGFGRGNATQYSRGPVLTNGVRLEVPT